MAPATSTARMHDTELEKIREKVLAGNRLGFEDGVALYRTHDLLWRPAWLRRSTARPPSQTRGRGSLSTT